LGGAADGAGADARREELGDGQLPAVEIAEEQAEVARQRLTELLLELGELARGGRGHEAHGGVVPVRPHPRKKLAKSLVQPDLHSPEGVEPPFTPRLPRGSRPGAPWTSIGASRTGYLSHPGASS